jgi:hypothetical protein
LLLTALFFLCSSPSVARLKRRAKYSATTTLSAAIAALTALLLTFKVSLTATKLIAPPMCLAARAVATFHPSGPSDLSRKGGYVIIIPMILDMVPTRKAIWNF